MPMADPIHQEAEGGCARIHCGLKSGEAVRRRAPTKAVCSPMMSRLRAALVMAEQVVVQQAALIAQVDELLAARSGRPAPVAEPPTPR